ncbi:biotin transporter BioY [Paenibacillus sp. FSL H7-0331]|uniref:biotin transporter BioY n=1 Tax=Paenibacillus sp. FSL H7-0331 TaxID=1920421 RepID=UPI00096BE3B1|nr:biotin transporter BioY [Paenibacillus sp. FSL H7-0331]OMF18242.1 biotin transporter BioY [Paenibacillus sp. FSL H7-0331]
MNSSAWNVRGLVFSALFATLFIVFSMIKISLGFNPVPFTLESFAVMLAGGLLGARYGFYSIFTVFILTAIGLPLLHGQGGISLIIGKTGGFIWMFPVAAWAIGWVSSRIRGEGIMAFLLLFVTIEAFGSLLLYVGGAPWLAYTAGVSFSKAMTLAVYPFILPDLLKALVASFIVLKLRKYVPSFAAPKPASPRISA